MFKARYNNGTDCYYRTVYADSEHEANKLAKRYARKGYRLTYLVGQSC